MSGHSKWATTKHRKAAQDAKRSKLFMKLTKEILVACQRSNNPENNPTLRIAVAKAKSMSMPLKNIQKAIDSTKDKNPNDYQALAYEGYLPHGISVVVECLTDNVNRSAANIKSIFRKTGGSIGKPNSASYLFDRNAVFEFAKNAFSEEQLMEETFEYLKDIVETNDTFVIRTEYQNFHVMKEILDGLHIEKFEMAEILLEPQERIKLSPEDTEKILKILEQFEDDDDVQNVYHNLELEADA